MLKIFDEIQKNLLNVLFPVFCNGCSNLLLKNEKVICTKCSIIYLLPIIIKLKKSEINKVFYGIVPIEFGASFYILLKKESPKT